MTLLDKIKDLARREYKPSKIPEYYNPEVGKQYLIKQKWYRCEEQTHWRTCTNCDLGPTCNYYGHCNRLSRADGKNVIFVRISASSLDVPPTYNSKSDTRKVEEPRTSREQDYTCEECGKVFKYDRVKRFCCSSCASAFNRKKRKKHKCNCIHCGKEFMADGPKHKFCSRDCFCDWHEAERKRKAEERTRNRKPRPSGLKYNRAKFYDHVCQKCGAKFKTAFWNSTTCHDCKAEDAYVRPSEIVECRECGTKFLPSRKGNVYCSVECGRRYSAKSAYRKRQADNPNYRLRIKRTYTCKVCGVELPKKGKVCSDKCRGELIRIGMTSKEYKVTKTCAACGAEFEGAAVSKYCSYKCKNKTRNALRNNRRHGNAPKFEMPTNCAVCGTTLDKPTPRQVYCGEECRKAGRRKIYAVNVKKQEKPVIITEN